MAVALIETTSGSGRPRCGTPGADPSPVQAGKGGGPGGTFFGRSAWRRAGKTGWIRVGAARDPGPWRQQAILGREHRDANALRDTGANSPRNAGRRGRDAGSRRDRFPEKAGWRAGWRDNTRDRRAGPPIAGRAFSPPVSRATATPSSTGGYTYRRRGRTIRRVWPVRMCRTAPAGHSAFDD